MCSKMHGNPIKVLKINIWMFKCWKKHKCLPKMNNCNSKICYCSSWKFLYQSKMLALSTNWSHPNFRIYCLFVFTPRGMQNSYIQPYFKHQQSFMRSNSPRSDNHKRVDMVVWRSQDHPSNARFSSKCRFLMFSVGCVAATPIVKTQALECKLQNGNWIHSELLTGPTTSWLQ